MIFILFSLAIFSFVAFYAVMKFRFQYFKWQGIPGPEPKFPLGNTGNAILGRRNVAYDVEDVYRAYKDVSPVSGFFAFFTPYLLATDPGFIKQMFIKDFKKFRNNDFTANHTKDPIIARNPFWMKDDAWKEKRNEMSPAMTPVKIKAMYPLINHATKSLVAFIRREIEKDGLIAFDARDICSRYTCDSISSCTYGADAQSFSEENSFFYKNGQGMLQGMADELQSVFPKKILPAEVESFFISAATDAIKCRTEKDSGQNDFLTHTIALKEKRGMDDLDVAAHCLTLFLDGYDTTGIVSHHALYDLARNKRVQEKLRAEIMDALDTPDGLSYDKLLELPYLDQVFYETLRLHPPLLWTTRVNSEDIEILGFKGDTIKIKKNTPIWIPIPTIHRDPEYYPNPDEFIPERFNPENGGIKAFRERCVLIPFGDGPRICSGMRFAFMQVKAAIVEVVRNFEISVDTQTPVDLSLRATEFTNITNSKLMLKFKSI